MKCNDMQCNAMQCNIGHMFGHFNYPPVLKHGNGQFPRNGGLNRKIIDFYGSFSSTPCLITAGDHEVVVYHIRFPGLQSRPIAHSTTERTALLLRSLGGILEL